MFRACTVLAYVAAKSPSQINISRDISWIKQFKKANPDAVIIGKNNDPEDLVFNTSNSPSEVESLDLYNKTIVHHSEGGVSGLMLANNAQEVLTGSFVNAKAVVRYVQNKSADLITLICMGYLGIEPAHEDELCARYIKALLCNEVTDTRAITGILEKTSGMVFFEGDKNLPPEDFYRCLDYNKFDFVLRMDTENDLRVLRRINV